MPHLVERRQGAIVITSSNAGLTPIPNVAPYVAAKHGVTGLMKALAVELAPFNIRVNAVHPCGVATDLVLNQPGLDLFSGKENATFEDAEPGMKSLNLLDVAPIKPQDVSEAILYLVSDAARYVTGSSLVVDAGTTICPPGSFRGPWKPREGPEPGRRKRGELARRKGGVDHGRCPWSGALACRGPGRQGVDIIAVDLCEDIDTVSYSLATLRISRRPSRP